MGESEKIYMERKDVSDILHAAKALLDSSERTNQALIEIGADIRDLKRETHQLNTRLDKQEEQVRDHHDQLVRIAERAKTRGDVLKWVATIVGLLATFFAMFTFRDKL